MTRRVERWVAAVALVPPLLYLATDRAVTPDVWRYTHGDLAKIALYGVLAGGWVWSYRLPLPRFLVTLRSLATVGLATLWTAAVAAEVTLRTLDRPRYEALPNTGRHLYDEDVGHVYRANFTQVLQTREWRQEWRSNAQGVRADRDFARKPDGVVRILVIGDSFTVGDQVPVDSTYPGVLQRLLDERFGAGRFEVVNAGFPAYGTVHEARWLEKFGHRFDADLVVLGMTPNDLIENGAPNAVIAHEGALARRGALGRRPLYEDRQQWYSVPGLVARSRVWESIDGMRAAFRPYVHRRAFLVEPDSRAVEQYERAGRHLLEARAAAAGLEATFAFITIPFAAQLGDLGEGLDAHAFGERWARFAEEHGIPFADVLPAFLAHPRPETLYWEEDGHCTAEGYALIGRTLFELLVRHAGELGLH